MMLVAFLVALFCGDYSRSDYVQTAAWNRTRALVISTHLHADALTCLYGGEVVPPSGADIDHVIPLKYAHSHGMADSSKVWKRTFATDTANLIPVCAHDNRSKGDKGPALFMPALNKCIYARKWLSLSKKYHLTLNAADAKVVTATVKACPN
jgi:hypothetical protein